MSPACSIGPCRFGVSASAPTISTGLPATQRAILSGVVLQGAKPLVGGGPPVVEGDRQWGGRGTASGGGGPLAMARVALPVVASDLHRHL